MKKTILILCFLLFCQTALSQRPAPNVDSLKLLVGKWVGEGTSEVGAGAGFATFESSLKDKVLVRKNHADYPATKDRPAVTHDDLMIIYADTASRQLRGFYTDSEGNTINYIISVSNDGKSIVFLSDPRDAGPRYRLTYVMTQSDRMTLTFEVASADKPDQFKKFIEGRIQKVH